MNWKEKLLKEGKTFITSEKGNSMTPKIKSGQDHELTPCDVSQVDIGDIVFCKVRGRYYTHLVKGTDPKLGALIGNNKGGLNGWTHQVYGKVTKIL